MTRTSSMGAAGVAAPAVAAQPSSVNVTYRGTAYVIDLTACQRAVKERCGTSMPDLVETVARAVDVHPEVVSRFLMEGHVPSPRVAVRIVIELAGRHGEQPPEEAGARTVAPRPSGAAGGVANGPAPDGG